MATTAPTITFADVIAYIDSQTTAEDVDALHETLRNRQRTLRDRRAALVRVGAKVTTTGLSPKCLNDLTGTVTKMDRTRGTITLDEKSTRTLHNDPSNRRYYPGSKATSYDIPGVPLTSLVVQD